MVTIYTTTFNTETHTQTDTKCPHIGCMILATKSHGLPLQQSLIGRSSGHAQWCDVTNESVHKDITFSLSLYHNNPSTAPVGLGFLYEVSRSHSDTKHSVGLLWTSDQPVAETSTWQHTTLKTDNTFMSLGGIRTHNLSRRAAADPRLRPRGHWDWLTTFHIYI